MIKELLCNGKLNPIGVMSPKIKLSVNAESETIDKVVFRVFDKKDAHFGEEILLAESKELYVYLDGSNFIDQKVYYFNAQVYSQNGVISSKNYSFEMGISNFNNAKWICNSRFNGNVSKFKKTFSIKGKVDFARLYIVGLGAYQSEINGKKTDEFFYKPLLTDFDKRSGLNNIDYDENNFDNDNKTIFYNTFDVSNLLINGDNELSVLLGTGYYYDTDKNLTDPKFYFDKPKLIFELHYWQNGKKYVVFSDNTCLCQVTNKSSQLFAGDSEDFSAKDNDFYSSDYALVPTGKIFSSTCDLDGIKEIISPNKISLFNREVFDFKKNHAGSLSIKVKGTCGSKITIKYYEFYDERGLNPYSGSCFLYNEKVRPIGALWQEDRYVLSGNIDEISPLFSWKCYRYVTIDCDGEYEILDIKSNFICSLMVTDGEFYCSNKFISDFYKAYILTQYDNLHCGVSTDCPHREKLPYTGDGCLIIDSIIYNFNCENFYEKWLKDIIFSQGNNGWIPYSAPYIGGSGGYFWSNIITVLPLKLYQYFGNKKYLLDSIDAIKKYIEYCLSMLNEKFLLGKTCIRWLLGEWLNPNPTKIDITLFNSIAFYCALNNAEKICNILSLKKDKKYYKNLKIKVKKAINKNYFNSSTLNYDSGEQGINMFALNFDIVEKKYKKAMFNKVVCHYEKEPYFDTGIIATPVLLDFLTKNDKQDLAYKIFTYQGNPSFYNMLKDESTLCEHWSKKWPDSICDCDGNVVENTQDVSHCHPMFGSVVSWFNKSIAGLDLSNMYKKVIKFSPKLISKISKAKAKKMTPYGMASIEYEKGDNLIIKIEVPYSCKAEIEINEIDAVSLYLEDKKIKKHNGKYKITLNGGNYILKEKKE